MVGQYLYIVRTNIRKPSKSHSDETPTHRKNVPGLKKHNKNEKCSNRNNVYLWDILLIYNRSTLVYGSMIFGIIFILFFSLLISSTDKHDRGKIVGCMQSNAYYIHFDPWLLIVLSRFLFSSTPFFFVFQESSIERFFRKVFRFVRSENETLQNSEKTHQFQTHTQNYRNLMRENQNWMRA